MDKNLLLAVGLSVAVYTAWFAFVERGMAPIGPSRDRPLATAQEAAARAGSADPRLAPSIRDADEPRLAPTPASAAAKPEVHVNSVEAQATIAAPGAALSSFRYQGPLGLVELVASPQPGYLATFPELAFDPAPSPEADTASFEARHPSGFLVRKIYRFGKPGQLGLLRLEFKNLGKSPTTVPPWDLTLGPGLGTVESEKKENATLWRAVGLFPPPAGRKKDRIQVLTPDEASPTDWRWLAVDNRYFIAAVMARPEEFSGFRAELVGKDKAPALRLAAKGELLAPGAVSGHDIPFYFGPKAYTRLESLGLGLERAVDFGWFDSIGRGVLKVLQYLREMTGNYGWSIILLTILLQICVFPLTYKSLKAAAVMRTLQPEIQRLQQKFGADPQRLNREMMELYKTKGANPMGGCLPMLIQIPVFVALFNALRNSWELHGSPWIGWVKDLSSQDPYYILPLLMGAVMFFQNKLNAVPTADPIQAKMMTWMPVVFTFMFLNFPAGLVLYWLTSSLLSVSQQLALKSRFS